MYDIPQRLDQEIFKASWAQYVQYRKELKKPLTSIGANRIFHKLSEWGYSPQEAAMALDQSIDAGWTGVFQLRKKAEGRLDGRIYFWRHNNKEEISDEEYDRLKYVFKERLRYNENHRCYYVHG